MNRTIKDATVKRYHYDDHDQLRAHPCATSVDALQLRPQAWARHSCMTYTIRVHLQMLDFRPEKILSLIHAIKCRD